MRNLSPILLALVLSGCASMLNKGRQDLTLDSQPSGASVTVNGLERGTTPYQYTYDPADGREVRFEVYSPGHAPSTLELRPKTSGGVLFADAMLLHIPFLADKNSPAMYNIPIREVTVDLYRAFSEDMARFALPITGMNTTLDPRASLGTFKGRPIQQDKKSVLRGVDDMDRLAAAVSDGLRNTWLDGRTARMGTTKGDEAVQRAKVHLKPQLRSMKATLVGEHSRCYGPVEMEIDWRFFSALRNDSVLMSLPMRTTYNAVSSRASDVLHEALAHAARMLAQEAELPALMAGHYGAGLALSRGGEVNIARPRPIPYNGRKEMLSALVKAVVTVQADKSLGSGFLIGNDGHLITNEHVVGREAVVKVKFEQGFTLDAQVLKVNKDFDLALLKVQATELPALTVGDDLALMLGEELFAIGTPLDATLGQSVSRGILSGRRELEGRSYLQTDVSINPGNSGGPLVDEDGRVVGVATMKISGKGLEGLGFGVPISVALDMLNIRMTP